MLKSKLKFIVNFDHRVCLLTATSVNLGPDAMLSLRPLYLLNHCLRSSFLFYKIRVLIYSHAYSFKLCGSLKVEHPPKTYLHTFKEFANSISPKADHYCPHPTNPWSIEFWWRTDYRRGLTWLMSFLFNCGKFSLIQYFLPRFVPC